MDRFARLLTAPIGPGPRPAGALGGVEAQRARALRFAAWALAAIALIWTSPLAAVWAKALADPLFHSTSSGAAVATLAFAAACSLRFAWHAGQASVGALRWGAGALLAGVLLAHGANLLAHLALARDAGFPASVPFYQWQGADNTYSYLLHSHAGKAALHVLMSGLLQAVAPGYDIGSALAGAVSPWAVAASAAGVVCATLATVVLLPSVGRRFGLAGGVFFAFCAWSCIKTSLDGGPLTYRFGPAVVGLLVVLIPLAEAPRAWLRWLAAATLPAGLAYLAWWGAVVDEPGSEAIGGFGATLALLAMLGGWAWRTQTPTQRWTRRAVVGVASVAVAASVLASLISNLAALLLPLPPAAQATVCDLSTLHCRVRAVGGMNAFTVYLEAGDDALKPRRTMIAETPDRGDSRLAVVVHARQAGQQQPAETLIELRPGGALPAGGADPAKAGGNAVVELRSTGLPQVFGPEPTPLSSRNYYVFLHLAAAQLRTHGLHGFVMAPLRHAADAAAFGLAQR